MKKCIIDVREPQEYSAGHVASAINIPPSELMSGTNKLDEIAKDDHIIVYCLSGSRSNSAIHFLKQMGFTNITNGINQYHVEKLLEQ